MHTIFMPVDVLNAESTDGQQKLAEFIALARTARSRTFKGLTVLDLVRAFLLHILISSWNVDFGAGLSSFQT